MKTSAKDLKRRKAFIAKQKSLGLCIECVNKAKDGQIRCESCLSRRRAWKHKKSSKARESGMCRDCFKKKAVSDSHSMCATCYVKRLSIANFGSVAMTDELLNLIEKQKYLCPYSGQKLVLGDNTELDHISPKSKGGLQEIENVQWVVKEANRMKDSLGESEFLNLVKLIYHYRIK